MNRERATIRARSIVGLYREETIATLPIEEVKADLNRLGVDSTEIIDLSRRLASGGNDDLASGLLARLEQADAADCEIADIERQSMQRILEVLPSDLINSAKTTSDDLASKTKPVEPDGDDEEKDEAKTTDIRIKKEIETLDVAFKPKRRLGRAFMGIGGSAVAIAASVFLIVTVRPDVLDQIGWSGDLGLPFETWSISTLSGDEEDDTAPEVETALAESDDAASFSQSEVRKRAAFEPTARNARSPSDDALSSGLSDVQSQDSGLVDRPVASALALDEPQAATKADIAATEAAAPAPNISALVATETEATVNGSTTLPDDLIGVFILDAARAPQELVALESVGRDNRLGAKRGEASLRALGRHVFALIAFERGGERIEAAVIEAKPGASGDTSPAAADSDASTPSDFEILELSRQR